MDKITQQKIKEAKQLLEQYAPKGEFLAYINEKEARILKAYGGAGKPIEQTDIPSFLAPIIFPLIMAISTVASFMGSLNNQKNIRNATRAQKNQAINKNNLDKSRRAAQGIKDYKELIARGGLSNTQLGTGSNLLAAVSFINETEEEINLLERNTVNELSFIDMRGASLLAKEKNSSTKAVLGGIAGTVFAGTESGFFS